MDPDEYVKKEIDIRQRALANRIRQLVKDTLPESQEAIKWNNLLWTVNGKKAMCIMNYPSHINFGFSNGASLHSKLLEGTGKGLRHIKTRDVAYVDAHKEEIVRIIKECAKKFS